MPTLDPDLYIESKVLRDHYLLSALEIPPAVDKASTHFLCLTPQRHVVGCVIYDPSASRLRQFIVAPTWRQQGIGRALLEAVKVEAIMGHGKTEVIVYSLEDTCEFFEKCGFVKVGDPFVDPQNVRCQCLLWLSEGRR